MEPARGLKLLASLLRSARPRPGPAVLAALVAAALAVACDRSPASQEEDEPSPPAVEVISVRPGPLRDVVDLVGQLVAEESVLLRPEISGVIDSIEFDEGQAVERDDVLFRLRRGEQLARVRVARAELSLAEEVHERTLKLADRDVSSAAALDRAAAELEVARANLELARVNLARTEIRAPFDGVLGARMVSPGDRVDTETVLVRIDAIAILELVFTLPEAALPLARAGLPVSLTVAPYPGESFPGAISFVSPSFDPDTRRVQVKARIPNPDERLRPGLFAKIEAQIARYEDAIVVPESAIVHGIDGTFVWRVREGGIAERAGVELGLRREGRVQIRAGLDAGDTIVSVGTHKVTEGDALRTVFAAPPEGASSVERAELAGPGSSGS